MNWGGVAICALVILGVSIGGAVHAQEASNDISLSELRWLHPQSNPVGFLRESPGECLRAPGDEKTRYLVEIGRAAFASPFLFGGPAARNGLSCNACHRDGRDNPDFFLEGLSGAPGTADVTTSVFSKVREDDIFNPVPIPSLVDAYQKPSFGSMQPHSSLHKFIDAAIEDEFQGDAPRLVIDGLTTYVAHLDSRSCPDGATAKTPERAMADIVRALKTAEEAMRRGDNLTADFLLLGARHGLGVVHERYAGQKLSAERDALEALSSALGDLRAVLAAAPSDAIAAMAPIQEQIVMVRTNLKKTTDKSLYAAEQLQRFFEAESIE